MDFLTKDIETEKLLEDALEIVKQEIDNKTEKDEISNLLQLNLNITERQAIQLVVLILKIMEMCM